jgi:hypothetical protein
MAVRALLQRAGVFAVIQAKFVVNLYGAAENVIGKREGAAAFSVQHNIVPT